MNCTSCGGPLPPSARTCALCGTQVAAPVVPTQPVAPWNSAPAAPVAPAPWSYAPTAAYQQAEGFSSGAGAAPAWGGQTPTGPATYAGQSAYGAPAAGDWQQAAPQHVAYAYPTSPQASAPRVASSLTGGPWFGPPLAGWGQRAGGFIIDTLITFVPVLAGLLLGGLLVGASTSTDEYGETTFGGGAGGGVALGLLVGLGGCFGVWLWQRHREGTTGQTLGKRAMGIRLVSEATGAPVGFGTAIGRHLLHFLDSISASFIIVPIGYLWPLWHNKKQTFADMLVKSVVISAK